MILYHEGHHVERTCHRHTLVVCNQEETKKTTKQYYYSLNSCQSRWEESSPKYQTKNETSPPTLLPDPKNPEIFISNFKLNKYVSDLLQRTHMDAYLIPTFLLNDCTNLLAPLVTELIVMIIQTKD